MSLSKYNKTKTYTQNDTHFAYYNLTLYEYSA